MPVQPPAPSDNSALNARQDSLIEYPCAFPIKVMGKQVPGLVETLLEVAQQFDPYVDKHMLELRESRTGKYLSVTITVQATSREQLDNLYRALSSHPLVEVVL